MCYTITTLTCIAIVNRIQIVVIASDTNYPPKFQALCLQSNQMAVNIVQFIYPYVTTPDTAEDCQLEYQLLITKCNAVMHIYIHTNDVIHYQLINLCHQYYTYMCN